MYLGCVLGCVYWCVCIGVFVSGVQYVCERGYVVCKRESMCGV